MQSPRSVQQEAGGAPGSQQQFTCGLCRERPLVEQVEEPLVEQVAVAWRRLWPMESPRRSRPRAGAAARGEEPPQE